MTKASYAQLGSVSEATLRPQDLLVAFSAVLVGLLSDDDESESSEAARFLAREAGEAAERIEAGYSEPGSPQELVDQDQAGYLIDDLVEALSSRAAPFCYFGALEGDGACFGFWVCWHAVDDAVADGELIKINAGDEHPAGVEVLEVSDHGNASLFSADGVEVWSVV